MNKNKQSTLNTVLCKVALLSNQWIKQDKVNTKDQQFSTPMTSTLLSVTSCGQTSVFHRVSLVIEQLLKQLWHPTTSSLRNQTETTTTTMESVTSTILMMTTTEFMTSSSVLTDATVRTHSTMITTGSSTSTTTMTTTTVSSRAQSITMLSKHKDSILAMYRPIVSSFQQQFTRGPMLQLAHFTSQIKTPSITTTMVSLTKTTMDLAQGASTKTTITTAVSINLRGHATMILMD